MHKACCCLEQESLDIKEQVVLMCVCEGVPRQPENLGYMVRIEKGTE